MKTSNKLLIGLFSFTILGMIFVNIAVRDELKKNMDNDHLTSDAISNNNGNVNINIDSADTHNTYSLYKSKNKILLSIDRNTTKEQLAEYKSELKKINIDFSVDKIEFNAENKISYIQISVNCNDGYKGSVSQSLGENDKIGFYRIYDKNAASPFGMNALPIE